ncbi:glucosidase 2 subunit beta-like [Ptychodera flava]|uniref:glucosidase 2 subunit beta-like n=1 Tax=Ptychodera flava TaxID=63121 RepID=UPI00396A2B94
MLKIRNRRMVCSCFIAVSMAGVFFISVQLVSMGTFFNDVHRKEADVEVRSRGSKIKDATLPHVRGVDPAVRHLYKPNQNSEFQCLDKSMRIPFSQVNDDYCDCTSDASDEPGTSACTKGRFFCVGDAKFVPSSRVNDGICDCCDGSDEWGDAPDVYPVPHSALVLTIPCQNTCVLM